MSDSPTLQPGVNELAAAVGVSQRRLETWIDAGLVRTSRDRRFDFRNASIARDLRDLHIAGVRPAKLRATLDRLRGWLPRSAHAVSAIARVDDAGRVLVRLGNGDLAEPTGQFRFDFDVVDLKPPLALRQPERHAEALHERGIAQELAGDLHAAIASYEASLAQAGDDAQRFFDLAHALAKAGQHERAVAAYRAAVALDAGRADAWNNLGDQLLFLARHEDAIDAFRRALALDPHDPAYHYNLADALDLAGRSDEAARHWSTFLHLAQGPVTNVAFAQTRLRALREA